MLYAMRSAPSSVVVWLWLLSSAHSPALARADAAQAARVMRPTVAELRAAYDRHDAIELERLARRIGAVRLVALVEQGSAPAQQAALEALGVLGSDDDSGGLGFLPRLVALADKSETTPALSQLVMQAVERIAARVPRGELDITELPADVPRAAVDALTAFAAREDRAAVTRVSAISAIASLASLVPSATARLSSLINVRDTEVRSAVAAALPASAPLLLKLLSEDGNNVVAIAAGSVFCRDIPAPGAERKSDKALLRAMELPSAARVRLRALVADDTIDEVERMDVLPCLRAGAQRSLEEQKADLEALRALARGPDGAMKRRARAYGGGK